MLNGHCIEYKQNNVQLLSMVNEVVLLQQEVLKPLYEGQASIKPVHTQNFHTNSSAAVNHCPSYSQKPTLPSFPRIKETVYPAHCPWNVSHYIAVTYYGHGEGVLGIGKFRS